LESFAGLHLKNKIGTVKHSYLTMEAEAESLRSIDTVNIQVNALGCFPGLESWCKPNFSNAGSILSILFDEFLGLR